MNVLGPDSSIGKPHIVILGCISEVGWGPTEGAENTRLSFTGQLEGAAGLTCSRNEPPDLGS